MVEVAMRTVLSYLVWLLCCKALGLDLRDRKLHIMNILIFVIISTAFVVGDH